MQIAILQYCSAKDIGCVMRCSKYWCDVCESDAIWKDLCLRLLPEEEPTEEEKFELKMHDVMRRRSERYWKRREEGREDLADDDEEEVEEEKQEEERRKGRGKA